MNADSSKQRILIVEDEPAIADVISAYLERDGLVPVKVARGRDVVPQVKSQSFDLILLDLNLPDIDGFELCKQIRVFSTVPIIMLTARSDEIDRITGLELGGDDYICKPFSPGEVMARVRAVLRRARGGVAGSKGAALEIVAEEGFAKLGGQRLLLTQAEFTLLVTLVNSGGRVRTRTQLSEAIGGANRASDRVIDTHVKNIRKKIAVISPESDLIRSVYGVGYRLDN